MLVKQMGSPKPFVTDPQIIAARFLGNRQNSVHDWVRSFVENYTAAVDVDYDLPLENAITSLRCYDRVNKDVQERHFQRQGREKGRKKIYCCLFDFSRYYLEKLETLIFYMQRERCLAMTSLELVHFGAANPYLQMIVPLVALGTPWYRLSDYPNFLQLGVRGANACVGINCFSTKNIQQSIFPAIRIEA